MSPIAQLMSNSPSTSPKRVGPGLTGQPFEWTREHIEANADTYSPWEALILQDSMGGSTPGATVQLKDEERRGLRQASEAQQVLARLVSILGTRGASLGKATVMDNYGKMVDAQSLRLEIDKGVTTYNRGWGVLDIV